MERNAEGNDNVGTKVISAENVEGGNSSLRNSWKKQKETVKFFFLFKIITLGNLFNCYFL